MISKSRGGGWEKHCTTTHHRARRGDRVTIGSRFQTEEGPSEPGKYSKHPSGSLSEADHAMPLVCERFRVIYPP